MCMQQVQQDGCDGGIHHSQLANGKWKLFGGSLWWKYAFVALVLGSKLVGAKGARVNVGAWSGLTGWHDGRWLGVNCRSSQLSYLDWHVVTLYGRVQ